MDTWSVVLPGRRKLQWRRSRPGPWLLYLMVGVIQFLKGNRRSERHATVDAAFERQMTTCPNNKFLARRAAARLLPSCYFTCALLAASGCTALPNPLANPPTTIVSAAELRIRTAVEARADEFAPLDLQRAREKLDASRRAMAAGQYEDARRLAETAYVEAELSEAKADAEITRIAADTLRQRSDALRQELERPLSGRRPAPARLE